MGLGIHYFIRFSLRYSLEFISGTKAYYKTGIKRSAEDFGAIFQVPVPPLLHGSLKRPVVFGNNIRPILNVTAGYALRNVGEYKWKRFSFTWAIEVVTEPFKPDSKPFPCTL